MTREARGKAVPDGAHPAVKELVFVMNLRRLSVASVSQDSGVPIPTIESWLYTTRDPSLKNLEAALNALGYELHIRPRREGQ